MRIIGERTFTAGDQSSFATLSGDANPIHLDEIAARRTIFGAPLVHGVHLLCWALESWFRNRTGTATALAKAKAIFSRGVLVGEAVQVAIVKEGDEFTLQIRRGPSTVVLIQGRLASTVPYPEALPPLGPIKCQAIDYATAAQAHGSLPLSYCAASAERLFPRLTATLPPLQLAILLATTRLVGMECPGLHSLYSAMDLTFDEGAIGKPEMSFRVVNAEPHFGQLRLAVQGPGFHGELRAFLRAGPCRQASARELSRLVEEGEFESQRAMVIGGSRGLGEVAAKLLAMGGADVMITYYRGKQDAEAVASEINVAGGRCRITPFDATHPAAVATPQLPTHLYYFATPPIISDKSVAFAKERFEEYCRYYVSGFVDTLLQVAQSAPVLYVFYPSTVFLDEPAHMAEYCAAKAAGEEVCRQLAHRFPAWRIHAPRLPRMLTDQNNGFLPLRTAAPEIVILQHLRGMNRNAEGA
jgi:acyl dehydratase